jgi:hypothetical protein
VGASSFFLSGALMMILINFFYLSFDSTVASIMFLGAIVGLIVEAFVIGTIAGIQFMGTGLNSASVKIIFGVSTLINCLFQVNVAGVPVGIGLANNILTMFSESDVMGFGWLITGTLTMMTLISGLVLLTGGSD